MAVKFGSVCMTQKINIGCLSLTSEMNDGNTPLRMTLKINIGRLSFTLEMKYGFIWLRLSPKNSGAC